MTNKFERNLRNLDIKIIKNTSKTNLNFNQSKTENITSESGI